MTFAEVPQPNTQPSAIRTQGMLGSTLVTLASVASMAVTLVAHWPNVREYVPERARDYFDIQCGEQVERAFGAYRAKLDACRVTVTIPRGGSVAGAAHAVFGEPDRWKEDRNLLENAYLTSPQRIRAGQTYTFRR